MKQFFVIVSVDEDGNEMIASFERDGMMYLMVTHDLELVRFFEAVLIPEFQAQTKKVFKLFKYSHRQEIREYAISNS